MLNHKITEFALSCARGRIERAKSIGVHLSREEFRYDDYMGFRFACVSGELEIAKWMHKRFNLTADVVRLRDNWCIKQACENNHIKLAKWLVDTFELTKGDISAGNNFAFWSACYADSIDTAKWLVEVLNLTRDDMNKCGKRVNPFGIACEYENVKIKQWLMQDFGFNDGDIGPLNS
uniref:Ankyrin repeat protein n=1 Tax=Pithovirus LCPAC404 TaxID=2506597 RepID=A0A481ZCI4_9VIRU|nr:MAG: ankyrin repeat protein [Pithovirus LCPAC404]